MKANKIITAAITLALVFPALSLLAQGPPGNPPGGGSSSGAPIDGGAVMLVASAAAYGYRMLKRKELVKNG